MFKNVRDLADTFEFKIHDIAILRNGTTDVQNEIVSIDPEERKILKMEKSTLWYQKKKVKEVKKIKMSMNDKKSAYFPGYNISNQKQEASKLEKLKTIYKKEGSASLIKKISIYITYRINYSIFNKFFILDGKKYHYFINIYNSVIGERVVEIPFAKEFLLKKRGKSILEIGNVLSHYFSVNHEIIDKYETNHRIINVDIIDFNTEKKYDLIISISTIEHVGFDEPHKDKGKSKKAILKIIDLLNSNGTAIITVPLGYNPEIDSIILSNEVSFTKKYFLKRVSIWNLWKETTMEDALKYKYGQKYPAANSVVFLIFNKEK